MKPSSVYERVLCIADDLRKKFTGLGLSDSLKIAAQINNNEILADGLCTYDLTTPVALEAIAMALNFDIDRYQAACKHANANAVNLHGRQSI